MLASISSVGSDAFKSYYPSVHNYLLQGGYVFTRQLISWLFVN